ncbi:hypothetical protein [Shimia sp. SDUM112013]|uniref:hypothetical protein n=1 Tax=Shimia sp. SDUM112013 TaxID=3136160 RepID=UPI0032EF6501
MAQQSINRKKAGRPPVAKEVARSARVVTFLTEAERVQLEGLADETDQSISSTCHQLISEGLERYRQ